MTTPHPTIYVLLHHDTDRIDAFADPEGTVTLEEVHVSANGGRIFVKFINPLGKKVLAGKISLATDPARTPFDNAKVLVHDHDNGDGDGHAHIEANRGHAPIRAGLTVGDRYSFDLTGTWRNGTRSAGHDPHIVIGN